MSADISGHQEVYTDLCGRFHTVLEIMKGGEREETEEKLDNLVTRWTGLQVHVHVNVFLAFSCKVFTVYMLFLYENLFYMADICVHVVNCTVV